MSFASHIAVYDSVPLPQFDLLPRQFVVRPTMTAVPKTWDKLEAVERSLDAFDWAAMVVRQPGHCTQFINDLAFAFVVGFESTLLVLETETQPKPKLDSWLRSIPEYDLRCRGVRGGLRNLDS
jgi:hypothetical protein